MPRRKIRRRPASGLSGRLLVTWIGLSGCVPLSHLSAIGIFGLVVEVVDVGVVEHCWVWRPTDRQLRCRLLRAAPPSDNDQPTWHREDRVLTGRWAALRTKSWKPATS